VLFTGIQMYVRFILFSLILILLQACATVSLSVSETSVLVCPMMFCASANICEHMSAFILPLKVERSLSDLSKTLFHRRRLHRGNRELRPGTHARTGANVAFCVVVVVVVPFMAVL